MDDERPLREKLAALEATVARVREENRLLKSILDQAPDFVAHITTDGRFLFRPPPPHAACPLAPT